MCIRDSHCWSNFGIKSGPFWDPDGTTPTHTRTPTTITSNIASNFFFSEMRPATPSRTILTRQLSCAAFNRRLKTNYCRTPPTTVGARVPPTTVGTHAPSTVEGSGAGASVTTDGHAAPGTINAGVVVKTRCVSRCINSDKAFVFPADRSLMIFCMFSANTSAQSWPIACAIVLSQFDLKKSHPLSLIHI